MPGPFSSDSKSEQKTLNQQITVSDQGIAYAPRRSNNNRTKNVTKLGKGATLTVNNGLSPDDFNAGLAELASSLTANVQNNPASGDDDAFRQGVLDALERRVDANTDLAVDNVKESAPSNVRQYLLWGIGVVVVVALVVVLGRKRK